MHLGLRERERERERERGRRRVVYHLIINYITLVFIKFAYYLNDFYDSRKKLVLFCHVNDFSGKNQKLIDILTFFNEV